MHKSNSKHLIFLEIHTPPATLSARSLRNATYSPLGSNKLLGIALHSQVSVKNRQSYTVCVSYRIWYNSGNLFFKLRQLPKLHLNPDLCAKLSWPWTSGKSLDGTPSTVHPRHCRGCTVEDDCFHCWELVSCSIESWTCIWWWRWWQWWWWRRLRVLVSVSPLLQITSS